MSSGFVLPLLNGFPMSSGFVPSVSSVPVVPFPSTVPFPNQPYPPPISQMSNFVLTPSAVAKLRRAIAPRSGNTGAVAATGVPLDPDKFPPPFTVRWSASENNGAGAWVIWLPDYARLVYYDLAWRAIEGIVAANTLPAGWYTMTAIRPQDTTVYLSALDSRPSTYGYVQVSITRADTQGAMGGEYFFCAKIAEMSVDSETGARRVKQFIHSTVEITKGNGGGGGSVTLDDVSTDWNTSNKVQIKDWDTGTPASSTTIAQDIHDGNTTAQGAVVERTTGGVLQYKKPGTLAQLLGSSVALSSQKVLTGLRWDTTAHTLVISSATVTVANGVITSWTANADENIETTAITSIIN